MGKVSSRPKCVFVLFILLTTSPLWCVGQSLPTPSPSPSDHSQDVRGLFSIPQTAFKSDAKNVVVDYVFALQWAIRTANTGAYSCHAFMIVSLGIWQALQMNDEAAEPVQPQAVAAYAGHSMLMALFPQFTNKFDDLLSIELQGLPLEVQAAAQNISDLATSELLAARANDGSMGPLPASPKTAPPGFFRDVGGEAGLFISLEAQPVLLPSNVTELEFVADFPPPPVYPSDYYNAQLTSVYLLGRNDSVVRTPDQTRVALFWSDAGNATTRIPGQWNSLALATFPVDITIERAATLLAKLNVGLYDSLVAVTHLKYEFDRWRPISAIRSGDAEHVPDPDWTPLLTTPNSPLYPSPLGAFAGVAEVILADFYGRDAYNFVVATEVSQSGKNLPSERFTKFSAAAAEITESRYFGGIEKAIDAIAGRQLGRDVGQYILQNFNLTKTI